MPRLSLIKGELGQRNKQTIMATIRRPGREDVKLTEAEFALMEEALVKMVKWESGGMFGDGDTITDKVAYRRGCSAISKLGY